MAESNAAMVRVKYTKSSIGYAQDQKDTVFSLGLRKMQQIVELPDTPAVRGMIFKVRHLVTVVDAGTEKG